MCVCVCVCVSPNAAVGQRLVIASRLNGVQQELRHLCRESGGAPGPRSCGPLPKQPVSGTLGMWVGELQRLPSLLGFLLEGPPVSLWAYRCLWSSGCILSLHIIMYIISAVNRLSKWSRDLRDCVHRERDSQRERERERK